MSEITLPSANGDQYQIVVGYDPDLGGYYIAVYDRHLRGWNDKIFSMQDDLTHDEAFDIIRLTMLDDAVATAQLDRRHGVAEEELAVILAMSAQCSEDDFRAILRMKETRH